MFDILDRPLLWIPVRWPGLKPGGPDGSGVAEAVENEIEVRIDLKTPDEIKILAKEHDEGEDPADEVDAIMLFATDWRKVVSGGAPLPFTRENVELFVKHVPMFYSAFTSAYTDASLGRVETREGNSDASQPDGPAAEPAPATMTKPRRKRTAAASA